MFKEIELDVNYNKLTEYVTKIVKEKFPECNEQSRQISIQHRKGTMDIEKQLVESTQSLDLDYENFDPDTMERPNAIPVEKKYKQEDFCLTPAFFKDTPIEDLNDKLCKKYNVSRGRIMNLAYKSCLSWHYDESPRLHIPIKIHTGSFMVLEDNIYKFEIGSAYIVDTTKMHTAVNAALFNRIHIVYCLDRLN
tara:strand:+ start:555 stop:1133 length:579 start_codon:yes stop_codon:yes gene_type:complete